MKKKKVLDKWAYPSGSSSIARGGGAQGEEGGAGAGAEEEQEEDLLFEFHVDFSVGMCDRSHQPSFYMS
jgi:hypothetical protein